MDECRSVAGRTGWTGERGFTLIETLFVLAILAVAFLGTMSGMFFSIRLNGTNKESARATRLARAAIERVRGERFRDAFPEFNSDAADDPGGFGTGAGNSLSATEVLAGAHSGPEMRAGFEFPVDSSGVLREDLDLPDFGLPADLNGDGAIDSDPRQDDYLVLPVRVQVTWEGEDGSRSVEFFTVLRE